MIQQAVKALEKQLFSFFIFVRDVWYKSPRFFDLCVAVAVVGAGSAGGRAVASRQDGIASGMAKSHSAPRLQPGYTGTGGGAEGTGGSAARCASVRLGKRASLRHFGITFSRCWLVAFSNKPGLDKTEPGCRNGGARADYFKSHGWTAFARRVSSTAAASFGSTRVSTGRARAFSPSCRPSGPTRSHSMGQRKNQRPLRARDEQYSSSRAFSACRRDVRAYLVRPDASRPAHV